MWYYNSGPDRVGELSRKTRTGRNTPMYIECGLQMYSKNDKNKRHAEKRPDKKKKKTKLTMYLTGNGQNVSRWASQ